MIKLLSNKSERILKTDHMEKYKINKMRFSGLTILVICLMSLPAIDLNGQTTNEKKQTTPAEKPFGPFLAVASVQMRSTGDLADNVVRMSDFIKKCAAEGARVVVFPECALSGYFEKVILELTAEQINEAEKKVRQACRDASVYAVIGMPYREGTRLFNTATVITPDGSVLERYHKVQLAERWPDPGDHLSVFKIDGQNCSIIICHDERYPELVRLPVLAGAMVIFYISHESGVNQEKKIDPYRAQIQARAVENGVFIVQSNAPANPDATGSHGQSRIIAPDGNIIWEATMFGEEVVSANLNLKEATQTNALRSISRGVLQEWWKEGMKSVRIID